MTGRHNFTAAHELAHHIRVRLYPDDYRILLNCRRHILYRDSGQNGDWEEWQANVLGARILMPERTVRCCMYMFGLAERLDVVSAATRPKEYGKFCDVAAYRSTSTGFGLWMLRNQQNHPFSSLLNSSISPG